MRRPAYLETFLVEWKLQQEQEKAERRLALETFLVEWKLGKAPLRRFAALPP